MGRKRSPFAVLIVILVLAGLLGIPAAVATPPDESGVVERGITEFWWWEFDFDSGLVALFGPNVEVFCSAENEPDPETGWTEAPLGIYPVREQFVFAGPLAETSDPFTGDPLPFPSFLSKIRDDNMPTAVYELNESFFTEFLAVLDELPPPPAGDNGFWTAFCGWFGQPPLAEGTTKLRFTDNDVLADVSNNNRSNAWGFVANGKLMSADEMTYNFHAVVKMVWSGDIFTEKFNGVFKLALH